MVGKDVLGHCKEVLNGGTSVREINDMFMVLIPKNPSVESHDKLSTYKLL